MLQLILKIATTIIDALVSDRRRRDEWKRRVASALASETAADDSGTVHSEYEDLERRAREGQHDGAQ
jgi:hypothetical protein